MDRPRPEPWEIDFAFTWKPPAPPAGASAWERLEAWCADYTAAREAWPTITAEERARYAARPEPEESFKATWREGFTTYPPRRRPAREPDREP